MKRLVNDVFIKSLVWVGSSIATNMKLFFNASYFCNNLSTHNSSDIHLVSARDNNIRGFTSKEVLNSL